MNEQNPIQETNIGKGLIGRVSEKPLGYAVQGLITLDFMAGTLRSGAESLQTVEKYTPQIKQIAGNAGIFASYLSLPLLSMALTAALGYIAVKGAGMYIDRHWYTKNTSDSNLVSN